MSLQQWANNGWRCPHQTSASVLLILSISHTVKSDLSSGRNLEGVDDYAQRTH